MPKENSIISELHRGRWQQLERPRPGLLFVGLATVISDAAVVMLAGVLTYLGAIWVNVPPDPTGALLTVIVPFAVVGCFAWAGLYSRPGLPPGRPGWSRVALGWACAFFFSVVLLAVAAMLARGQDQEWGISTLIPLAHESVVAFFLLGLAGLIGVRLLGRELLASPMASTDSPGTGKRLRHAVTAESLLTAPIVASRRAALIKRIEDLVLVSGLLVATAPIMLLIAVAIRLTSSGPLLFRQRRAGLNGEIFYILKFRTMYTHMTDLHAERQTSQDDPRVTRVGRVLRRHSLDELPQLFNVMGGSMSLVGPRPHAMGTSVGGQRLEELVPRYSLRHYAKPGITGWAQVSGWRGEMNEPAKVIARVEHDLEYIANWSVLFDLRIILRSVMCVLKDNSAY